MQLTRLKHMGMTAGEEAKLVSMRDYILKLARNMSRYDHYVTAGIIHLTIVVLPRA